MCPGLDLSEPKRRWLSWGPPRAPLRAFIPPAGAWSLKVGMSLPSTIVLSGTKEMRSWAALVWHLGAQEQVGKL